jgi:hypothetical protein
VGLKIENFQRERGTDEHGRTRTDTDGHGPVEPEIRNPPAKRDEIRNKSE